MLVQMLVHVFCPLFCPRICRLLDRDYGKEKDEKTREREGSLDEFDASRMLDRPPEPTNATELLQQSSGPNSNPPDVTTPPVPDTEPPDTSVRKANFLLALPGISRTHSHFSVFGYFGTFHHTQEINGKLIRTVLFE